MVTFVAAGTNQAAEYGAGDATYFASIERKVEETLGDLEEPGS